MKRETITIYYTKNNELQSLEVKFADNDYKQTEIMQASFISLNFTLPYYLELPIGAYIEDDGEKFYLLDLCQPTKHNSENFDYSVIFYNTVGLFNNWIVQYFDDANPTVSIKFPLTEKPERFIDMIVRCCNTHIPSTEQQFSVGECEDKAEQLVSFDSTTVLDALNSIAEAFNTEWYVTSDRKIGLKKLSNTPSDIVTLQYGSGFGIKPDIQRKNTEQRRIDKIFVQGGDRNIRADKYGSQYLLLPKIREIYYDGEKFYPQKAHTACRRYVTDEKGLSIKGQDYYSNVIHSERGFDGSNIYPSRIGKISDVKWCPNKNETEYNTFDEADAQNSDDDKGIVFCNIYDTSIPNDLDYFDKDIRAEGTETITFQSGKMAGRTVEVSTYDHAKRVFKLMRTTDSGVDMPNKTFYPAVGDEYIVFGMQMPDSYIAEASENMMKEAIKEMYEYELDQVLFSLPIDEIWYKRLGETFKVGDNINYIDDNFAPNGLKIRITQIKEYLSNSHKVEIILSNCRRVQSVKRVLTDFRAFKDNFPTIVSDRMDFFDKLGNGTNTGTTFKNQSWARQPFPPYYEGDVWLVNEDITISGIMFKGGVSYRCNTTRLTGEFNPVDWLPMSIYKYDDLNGRPKVNGNVLTGDVQLATQTDLNTVKNFINNEINERINKICYDLRGLDSSCGTFGKFNTAIGNVINALNNADLSDVATEMQEMKITYRLDGVGECPLDTNLKDITLIENLDFNTANE